MSQFNLDNLKEGLGKLKKKLPKKWGKTIKSFLSNASVAVTLLITLKSNFWDKQEQDKTLEKIQSEQIETKNIVEDMRTKINFDDKLFQEIKEISEQKGAAKKEAEILERELEKTRNLARECSNESQQLDIILTLNEISKEDRKIDKNTSSWEWLKDDEVKSKLHEIGKKRERCKGRSHCNNSGSSEV